MNRLRTTSYLLICQIIFLGFMLFTTATEVKAATADESTTVGIAALIGMSDDADTTEVQKATKNAEEIGSSTAADNSKDESSLDEKSDLVMANVDQIMNVRTEPSENADKAGVLYKDCGGRILDRKNGWTKLQSGDLVGWAKDEYLLFDRDAQELAEDVGNEVIVVKSEALRVRDEDSQSANVLGVLVDDNRLDLIEDLDNGWLKVEYGDEDGYVQSQYVDTDFSIDAGETIAAIAQRAKEEEERKAKEAEEAAKQAARNNAAGNRVNTGAVAGDADDARLLGALIQCEAGNQPYDGKVAVGAVVMNRLKSGAYPNSIEGVIYASGQFTPALNGKVERIYNSGVSASCMQAAQDALAGNTTVGTATHFRRAGNREGIVIGAHVFW